MDKFNFGRFSTQIITGIKTVDTQSHKPTHASAFLVWYSKPTSDVKSVVELGSGTGIVAFSLAKLYNVDVVGVELQEELYKLSLEGRSLNNLDERVQFVNADVRNIKDFSNQNPSTWLYAICHFTLVRKVWTKFAEYLAILIQPL